ncbi:MAG: HU family DNA-binding protein [Paludibacteraceae bacterium]|nr:HU family DNA-binding protein [Paludibacteraceae bacterium]
MNNKISWVELRRAIAVSMGASEKEVAPFLNALTEQIIEALKTEHQVRIGGLGTFRLQAIAPRKSVNVVTGEAFTIEGYNKIVFAPEAAIKELFLNVTAPSPAQQEDATPLRKLNEQAEEIVGLLSELGQEPHAEEETTEEPKAEETAETPIVEPVVEPVEKPVVEPEPLIEPVVEPIVTPTPEPIVIPPVAPTEPTKPTTTIDPITFLTPSTTTTTNEVETEEEEEKKHHTGLWIIIILLLLLIGAGVYFYMKGDLQQWGKQLWTRFQKTEDVTSVVSNDSIAPCDTIAIEPAQEVRDYSQLITTEKIREGSRLTWLAYRYYGAKDLWVFIYEANKDVIRNPHNIEKGTPIRIPKLPSELKDLNNPQTRQLVDSLIQAYK